MTSGRVTHEELVAALEVGPPKSSAVRSSGLDERAHGAVEDDDPFTGGGEEVAHGWFSWRVEDKGIFAASWGHLALLHQDSSGAATLPGDAGPVGGTGPSPAGRGSGLAAA